MCFSLIVVPIGPASHERARRALEIAIQEISDLKVSLIQWLIGVQLGYGALIVAVVALL